MSARTASHRIRRANPLVCRAVALALVLALGISLVAPAPMLAQQRQVTTADAYREYVDRMIPLSFTYAQRSAQLDEYVVASEVRAGAQSDLAQATAAASVLDRLIPLVAPASCPVSPTDEQTMTVLSQLLVSQQLLNAVRLVGQHVDQYHHAKDGLADACARNFEGYTIERLNLQFAEPKVDLLDGAYIQGPDPIMMFWTGLKSLWQAIVNQDERDQIKQQSERLARERAKDADIQNFARQACQTTLDDTRGAFTTYDALAGEIDALLKQFPMQSLLGRHEGLRQCVDTIAEDRVTRVMDAARSRARELLQGQSDADARLLMDARVALDLAQQAALLRTDSCPAVRSRIETIEADRDLGEIYALPNVRRLDATVTQIVDDKRASCGGRVPGIPALRRPIARVTPSPDRAAQVLSPAALQQRRRELTADIQRQTRRPLAGPRTAVGGGADFTAPPPATEPGPCDFDETTHYPSLCSLLHQTGGVVRPTFSLTTDRIGAYTQVWTGAGEYTLPYGQVTATVGPSTPAWDISRTAVTRLADLPGKNALARGAEADTLLNQHLSELTKRSDELGAIVRDFRSAHNTYIQGPVTTTIPQSVTNVRAVATDVRTTLEPILGPAVPATGGSTPPTNPMELASPAIRGFAQRLEENLSSPSDRFHALDELQRIAGNRLAMLPPADRAALESLRQQYFEQSGLLNERALGRELVPLSQSMGTSLRTDPSSGEGQAVRRELNRGLLAAASPQAPDLRDQTFGALSLVVGADAAYASGATADGDHLLSTGAEILDFTLGLIPGVSSINDAAQIVYGIATGHDFAGHPMTSADFALRGLGVVVGALPVGGAITRIAGRAMSEGFVHGATLVRRLGFAERLADATPLGRRLAVDTVEAVGHFLPENAVAARGITNVAEDVGAIVERGRQIRVNATAGAEFETRVLGVLGRPREYTRILVGEATDAAYRIPDYLSTESRFLLEIKNQRSLSLSNQFRDYISYCEGQTPPFVFKLYVRPEATLSAPLAAELQRIGAEVYDVAIDGAVRQRLF